MSVSAISSRSSHVSERPPQRAKVQEVSKQSPPPERNTSPPPTETPRQAPQNVKAAVDVVV